ncbi:MAG TPA: 50S ribosomal protein L25 [Acidimicrobiales bacterium]|jgi:large subunit ribosomal protein L25|nr:50S ribosomal protein L25 [Acidimicrobiales bacterium]
MPETTLVAEPGRPTGTRPTRRLRHEGKIPGVVYGHGIDAVPVSVVAREFRTAMSGEASLNTLLTLDVSGTTYLTLARDIQRHPVKGTVTHIDFLIVRRDEVIAAEVTITLVGEAVEVHHGDGVVDQQLFTLPIRAIPTAIPSSLELDISELIIGGSLKVSDIKLATGVTADIDEDVSVVVGQPPRVATTGEEGFEGEAAEGQEGAVAEAEVEAGGATGEGEG